MGGSSVHKGPYKRKREAEGWEYEKGMTDIAGFEDGRRGHEPGNVAAPRNVGSP